MATGRESGPGRGRDMRRRCWEFDWIIDLDVQKFFDTVSWDLVVKAVQAVTDCRWVLLYVKRWLAAPLQRPDGTLVEREKGTPQGSLCAAAHNEHMSSAGLCAVLAWSSRGRAG